MQVAFANFLTIAENITILGFLMIKKYLCIDFGNRINQCDQSNVSHLKKEPFKTRLFLKEQFFIDLKGRSHPTEGEVRAYQT